jgi:L-alanine-DL-glutamate epimerase-like enolase superfamily enzyme
VKVETELIKARLRAPFVSARGSVRSVSLLRVTLTDVDGVAGQGEAVEDVARWDLEGRRSGEPVWKLLGASAAAPVEVNATIAGGDPMAAAAAARDAGFSCVKVKVGLGDDADRVAAIRKAAGPDLAIRLDANGAWSVEQAIAALRELEPFGIELCEQPASGVEACAEVAAAVPVPVSLDESALDGLGRRVCDAVCLKVARCGGITGLLEAARRAREAGYRVYLASMLDGPLGIAAALHAAAVVRPDHACGLATLGLFDRRDPLPPINGRLAVPPGPGLGDGLLDWYRS